MRFRESKVTNVRCPFCSKARVFKLPSTTNYHCRSCDRYFSMTISEISLKCCVKCNKFILPGQEMYIGNGDYRHIKCRVKNIK